MSPERDQPPQPSDRGVFGNLPNARPGVRSPRRAGKAESRERGGEGNAQAAKAARVQRPSPTGQARRPARPQPSRPASTEPPGAAQSEAPASRRGGVEEIAWAGITVAAEAATLGVRMFSRALEAVRERR